MAPTPINTANEWVSNVSDVSTFIEQYPLNPRFTRWELIAPTAKTIGIFALVVPIFLSLRTKVVEPSLTEISASFFIFSKPSFKVSVVLKVQSMVLILLANNFLNFLICEFDSIGLSSTYIVSSVKLSKSRMFPKLPNLVFRLITLFSLSESIGGLVTWLKFCLK